MKFQPNVPKKAVKTKFIEGSLSRFDGKTLSVGYGTTKPLSRRKFVLLMRKVISLAKQNKVDTIAVGYKDIKSFAPTEFSDYEVGKIAGTAFVMADYEYTTYKSKPKDGFVRVQTVAIPNTPKAGKEGFWHGEVIATEINACRELANTPGSDMTPVLLADAARKAARGTKVEVSSLGRTEMEALGMGALLGVAKGSPEEPQLIVMEYKGGNPKQKPIVLVGKGVTFDTGGLQIKPGDHMYEMHMDMSGGAAVIHAVALAAKLKIKANVVGIIPSVENAASGSAMRPGDILTSLSGKTIEVLHTDAEGRLILADALTYAKRFKPALVADAATLTGAALITLGEQASAFMTNREEQIPEFMQLGEESGDYLWPLPLWEEYDYILRSSFADMANIPSSGNSRYAGTIGGGKFLEAFAKELNCPWIHVDMAPKMTSNPEEFLAKGAAGAPVRFFLALIQKHAQK